MEKSPVFKLFALLTLGVLVGSCTIQTPTDSIQAQAISQERSNEIDESQVIPNAVTVADDSLSNSDVEIAPEIAPEIAAAPLLEATELAAYRWENRLLFIFAPTPMDSNYLDLMAAYAELGHELEERDMLWFHILAEDQDYMDEGLRPIARLQAEFSSKASALYNPDGAPFRVVLIGKDGGVKHVVNDLLAPADLFSIIDAMPMRQQEMKTRSD